jgi:hypothetical protein
MDAALENEVAKLTDEDEEPATATREKLVWTQRRHSVKKQKVK